LAHFRAAHVINAVNLGGEMLVSELLLMLAEPIDRVCNPDGARCGLALQLPFQRVSESMGNHDSKIVDADSVD
jgi:hypothetical protein